MRAVLPSGMRLIIAERPGNKLATILVRVRAGSGAETSDNNGVAHFIEHAVFKGGGDRKPGDFDAAMEKLGGEFSARTNRDFTEYSATVPAEKVAEALKLFADLLQKPAFAPEEVERERVVIRAEMAAARSEAGRVGFQQLAGVVYNANDPYRLPLMGTVANVGRLAPEDLRQFWQTWYRPENMTLVVTGGVETGAVRKSVEGLFPVQGNPSPQQPGVTVFVPLSNVAHAPIPDPKDQPQCELSTMIVAFRAPAATETDILPLFDTLMPILANGKQGRLYTRLVEKEKVAYSVVADFIPGRTGSLIMITLQTRPELMARLEKSLEEEIRRIREDPLSDGEIEAARATARNRTRYDAETVEGQARQLAFFDTYSPKLTEEDYLVRVEAVSSEDLRKVILRYLTPLSYAVAKVGPPPPADPIPGVAP